MMSSGGNQSKRLETVVQLGFSVDIEDNEHRLLVGHNNPDYKEWDGGQLGGRPTWLNPKDIPNGFLKCKNCDSPMMFVCQLYAPCDEVNDDAFHRSFYVFACPDSTKCSKETTGSIRVLRTQLPKENPYFPEDHDETWTYHLPASWNKHLCKVCGQQGRGKCPIQQEYFCGPHHQKEYKKYVFDKLQQHQQQQTPSTQLEFHFLPSVLTESELVVEEEPIPEQDNKTRKKAEKALFKAQGVEIDNDSDDEEEDSDKNLEQKDLNEMVGAADETVSKDSATMKFYDRIHQVDDVKTQCLRYLRWPNHRTCEDTGTPLWIRSDFQPDTIPSCERCGTERRFEFQLMPQMLHYLFKDMESERAKAKDTIIKKEDIEALQRATSIMEQAPPEQVPPDFAANKDAAIDTLRNKLMEEDAKTPSWGVVSIYTCTDSCGGMEIENDSELGAYFEEFAWKQPSLD
ncbi:programmed cell death protein [Nitzschia inconspicua]|uniref:Programmed cell death protein n=1 Tax=Nitzschia inconspicua TaxID=303405 RepID=A0A9K3K8D3_9STRA|nr:programmed cell death protein [Nitzschia inconspicua]KAG7342785.1 programmed cell death protein [Nitzschia inconspicua]